MTKCFYAPKNVKSCLDCLSGSTFYSRTFTSGNSINTGTTITLEWTETLASAPTDFLQNLTEYVVRVTTTTGFQYDMVATSPSS